MLCRCQESGINGWNRPRRSLQGWNLWADNCYALQDSELLQSDAIYVERRLFNSSFFFFSPLFLIWIPLASIKKLAGFFAGIVSHSISIFHLCIEGPLWKNFSMPTGWNFSQVAPRVVFLPHSSSRQTVLNHAERLGGWHKGPHRAPNVCAVICPRSSDWRF